ncbi:MAG: DUF4910 domain-containing protein [Halanaerobiales bacterium]|nr:DUF4910 domain-containing protein [Halanaerobiales bacterium]
MKNLEKKFKLDNLITLMKEEANSMNTEKYVAKIAKHHRIQNSPGFDNALNEMVSVLSESGVMTRVECFKSDDQTFYQDYVTPGGWVGRKGKVSLKENGEILADFTVNPIQLIQRSCSTEGKEILEVYVIDDIDEVLKEKPDLTGKMILTNLNVHKIKDLILDPLGARGILFDGMHSFEGRDADEMKSARQYTSFWWQGDEIPTFGFVLSPVMGQKLRERFNRGEQVFVECEVETEFLNNTLKVLHACIPGKTDKNLLLVGHICHPYPSVNDNASGAAAGVEVMCFVQRLIQEKKLPKLDRGIELILVPEYSGTFAFLDRYIKERKYLAGVNLDMVGEDQKKCGSTLLVIAPPLGLSGLSGDLLYHLLKEVSRDHDFQIKKSQFMGGSDHAILTDPLVGIPCPMLIQQPDQYYHTDQDTLDKLDPVILKDVTLSSAIYLYYLANAHLKEVEEIMGIYQEGFIETLNIEMEEFIKKVKASADQQAVSEDLVSMCTRRIDKIIETYLMVGDYFEKYIIAEELNDYKKFSLNWQKDCQSEGSRLIDEIAHLCKESMGLDITLKKSSIGLSELNDVEKELAQIIPKRKYWGFSTLSQKRHLIGEEHLPYIWKLIEEDSNYISVLAQYFADGQRNLLEIVELIEIETRERKSKFIRDFFRYLQEMGSIEV